jgi:hypothetical protein
MFKNFYEQRYKHVEKLRITMPDFNGEPDVFEDEIKGLNRGHALYLARLNWKEALKIEPVEDDYLNT